MITGITKTDCEKCGAKESVYCADIDKGVVCQMCGADYGNPYAVGHDVPVLSVWRRFVNGIQHPISCNCCGCVHGDRTVTHPLGCICFDCKVLMN